MGRSQRNKGATAERELARLLSEQLGAEVSRNLLQTRQGGHDLTGIAGWAVEVKRHETLSLGTWWTQALIQARRADARPALLYRQSRQPWRAVVRLADIQPDLTGDHLATLSLEGFCQLVRESAGKQAQVTQGQYSFPSIFSNNSIKQNNSNPTTE